MKTLFTVLVSVLILCSTSYAQLQIGPKAGLNIANVTGDDAGNPDSKIGFPGGLFLKYQFSQWFAIQPEVYYTMKGAEEKVSIFGTTVDVTASYDYIEIPFLLKLVIPIQGSNVHPAIFAGPSVGFNTTAKVKAEAMGESAEEDIENVTSSEFALHFGGGVGFPVGNNELGFDIRYILGLNSIDDSAGNLDLKHGVINFNIFFGFSIQ